MSQGIRLAPLQQSDWARVRAIYAEGLASRLAAFRLNPPLWKDWDRGYLTVGRLVARDGADIVGWGALAPVADT